MKVQEMFIIKNCVNEKKKNNNYVVSTKQMYLGNDGNIVTDRRAARSFNTIDEAFATLDLINDIKDKFGEVFVIDDEFKKKNRPTPVPENPAKEVVKRIQFSPSVRHKVYEKSNVCCICGKPIDEIGFSIDHKIPLSRGGSNDLENLQPVCPECNRLKGNYTNEEMHNAIGGIYCNNLYNNPNSEYSKQCIRAITRGMIAQFKNKVRNNYGTVTK